MWFDSTVTAMRKLKIAYNNGLRRILNLPKYNSAFEMFVNLNIPSFDELLYYTCQLLKLYYKIYRNRLPSYFEMFLPEYGAHRHNLRNGSYPTTGH